MEAGKTPKGAKTKNRIIDAAIKLIKEKGVEKTTLVEVCTIAKVAQGTFYHYFKSINDILYEILRIEGEELHSFYKMNDHKEPQVQLREIMEFQIDYYEKKGKAVVAQIFRNEFEPYSGESRVEQLLPIRAFVTRIISKGMASGCFSSPNSVENIVIEIMSIILFYSYMWIKDRSEMTLKDTIGSHLDEVITNSLCR